MGGGGGGGGETERGVGEWGGGGGEETNRPFFFPGEETNRVRFPGEETNRPVSSPGKRFERGKKLTATPGKAPIMKHDLLEAPKEVRKCLYCLILRNFKQI